MLTGPFSGLGSFGNFRALFRQLLWPVTAQRTPHEEEPSNTVNSQVNETTKDK